MKLHLKSIAILIFLFIGASSLLQAQSGAKSNLNLQTEPEYDPIIAALDSLVMLNNVIRFQQANGLDTATQELLSDEIPHYSDEIYAQRMSKLYSPIPLEFNEQVKRYIEVYAYKRRTLTGRVLGLSNLYFPMFEEILDQEGLPLEFKYLSVVESALNPVAVSRMGATGLWQFMYNTGKMYDLKIDSYYDERRDPEKATRAACEYFKDMYAIYGDWLLVIAAYNCGPGNVNKAIRRSGGSTNFWDISPYLPSETRGYVPAFIAVTYVMNYASEHQIFAEKAAFNYIEIDTVAVDNKITLSKIATELNLPLEVVSYLNPIYKRGVIPDSDSPNILRIPTNRVQDYLKAEASLFTPEAPSDVSQTASVEDGEISNDGTYKLVSKRVKKVHTVRGGESLSVIAEKRNCRVSELRKWNNLSSTLIHKGQRLSYYTTVHIKVPIEVAKEESSVANSSKASANEQKKESKINDFIYHDVVAGDTLWNIAKRYNGATVEQIIEINKISDKDLLKPGTRLKVKVNG